MKCIQYTVFKNITFLLIHEIIVIEFIANIGFTKARVQIENNLHLSI